MEILTTPSDETEKAHAIEREQSLRKKPAAHARSGATKRVLNIHTEQIFTQVKGQSLSNTKIWRGRTSSSSLWIPDDGSLCAVSKRAKKARSPQPTPLKGQAGIAHTRISDKAAGDCACPWKTIPREYQN
ncbi:hypothetical protein TNCV_3219131 [Trichonephila clavipes]|nr:hypothetical protein TNCV_3219131 [Trichonephila clavipes]